ncbi:hypothetical protein A5893_12015 [Pedobacter psychrophilus]|uniref:TonB C-terminal domain-containing protein n=1 Tax=Pedobacter psychrophilus TaxID=1826909 RepID=A0A179DCK7_9SPHI|nr:hypothetical protein [Pedobacter psychrophilus]OAQ38767.1 hypothetical protein A5893_12015 [Pedobacter psychrophilus]
MNIKNFTKVFLIFSIMLVSFNSFSQKKQILTEEEQVQEEVGKEIETAFKSEAFLKKMSKKFPTIKGYVVTDISVVQNGKIATFFKVDSDIKDNDFFEFLSDYLLNYKFNFKLPKQQKYKIRQTIEI